MKEHSSRAEAEQRPLPSDSPVAQKKKGPWGTVGRLLLLLAGGAAIFGIVSHVGVSTVWTALSSAGWFLPLIFALDLGWLATESLAIRALYGEQFARVPRVRFVHALLVHYVTFLLIPMGRASGEVARAALLSRYVGKHRATTTAALMQSLTMTTNALISLVSLGCLLSVAPNSALVVALVTNVAATGAIGVVSYLVMRHVRIGGFLGRRFSKLAAAGPEFDAEFQATRPAHRRALGFCLAARVVQTAQYGILVYAVVGSLRWVDPWIAEGVQLVARSAGDMVPNQVGVTEGAFALFRGALGLHEQTATAVAIALLARLSNLTMAGSVTLLLQFWRSARSQS